MMTRYPSSKLLLVAATVFAVFANTHRASVHAADGDDSADKLAGTWALTVPGTPFRINRTFFANGTNVDASTFTPIAPIASGALIVSDGHGAWQRTGHGTYAVTLFFFQLNPATGALDTYGKVRETVRIDHGVYHGVFETDIFAPDGTLRLHLAGGTTEGVLIPAEPAS
jgi:hypothetical protein